MQKDLKSYIQIAAQLLHTNPQIFIKDREGLEDRIIEKRKDL